MEEFLHEDAKFESMSDQEMYDKHIIADDTDLHEINNLLSHFYTNIED